MAPRLRATRDRPGQASPRRELLSASRSARRSLLAAALASHVGRGARRVLRSLPLDRLRDARATSTLAACATVARGLGAGRPFPADFCAWSTETARTNASRACAWLGACAGPVGDNAFGPCVVRALLAYDCAANPDRRLRPGPAHDLWDHLWRASSCADVLGALFPPRTIVSCAASSSTYAACAGETTLVSCNVDDAGSTTARPASRAGGLRAQTCAS